MYSLKWNHFWLFSKDRFIVTNPTQGPIGFLENYNYSINNWIIRSEVTVKLAGLICATYLLCFRFWTSFNSAVSVVFRQLLHAHFCTHYSATLPALWILLVILCMSFLQNMEISTKALGLALEKAFFQSKGILWCHFQSLLWKLNFFLLLPFMFGNYNLLLQRNVYRIQ